ncbi:MAG: histidine phosphatase family protein [Chitinophagaceae bacterium]|nr:histidine phosphatase family protein [Chitinophagaceae bacterium]
MKTLIIIRHAKSNQNFWGNDFERPLNERGLTDAPKMAKKLLAKISKVDAFISSPAVRAKTTAQFFAKEYGLLSDDIVLISALYHAGVETFYEVINAMPGELNSIALFSHNPGITFFINDLETSTHLDNMPTCGMFAVQVNTNNWENFATAKKEFLFFDYPKM